MTRNDTKSKRRKKPLMAAALIGLLILLGLLLRSCFGLGPGTDEAEQPPPPPPQPIVSGGGERDAGNVTAVIDARGARAACELFLAREGLQLNGKPSTIADAVVACRTPGAARLRVTGDARTGTYKELLGTFKESGIPVAEEQW